MRGSLAGFNQIFPPHTDIHALSLRSTSPLGVLPLYCRKGFANTENRSNTGQTCWTGFSINSTPVCFFQVAESSLNPALQVTGAHSSGMQLTRMQRASTWVRNVWLAPAHFEQQVFVFSFWLLNSRNTGLTKSKVTTIVRQFTLLRQFSCYIAPSCPGPPTRHTQTLLRARARARTQAHVSLHPSLPPQSLSIFFLFYFIFVSGSLAPSLAPWDAGARKHQPGVLPHHPCQSPLGLCHSHYICYVWSSFSVLTWTVYHYQNQLT